MKLVICFWLCVHASHTHGGQRTTSWSRSSPSTVPGMELGWSDLLGKGFTHWAASRVPIHLFTLCIYFWAGLAIVQASFELTVYTTLAWRLILLPQPKCWDNRQERSLQQAKQSLLFGLWPSPENPKQQVPGHAPEFPSFTLRFDSTLLKGVY